MYKLLYVSANPFKDLNVDLDFEYKAIFKSLACSANAPRFALSCEVRVRYLDLPNILSAHRPDLVHFCVPSFGDIGFFFDDLVLGGTKPSVKDAKLGRYKTNADFLAIREILLEYKVQVAVLTTPISRRNAVRVADIGVVIGFDNLVPDIVSSKFVHGFYRELIDGKGLKQSYDVGAEGIFDSTSETLPFLEYKSDIRLNELFKIQPSEILEKPPVVTTKMPAKDSPLHRVSLRKVLQSRFNVSELKILCFDMDIDYESIIGKEETKTIFITKLIKYCERTNRLLELRENIDGFHMN